MLRIIFTISIMLFCINPLSSAEDITLDELIHGANNARLTIKSGEIQTETTEETAARKTEEEIAASIQKDIEAEMKGYVPHEGVDTETFKNEYLIPNLKYNYNRSRKYTEERHATTLFQIMDTDTDSYHKLFKYKLTMISSPGHSLDSETAQNHHADLIYFLGYDLQIQLKLDIGDILFASYLPNAATISDFPNYVGYGHYSNWGRSHFRVPAGAKHVGKESIDGVECHVLEFPNVYQQKTRIWVDESIDFCIRKIDIFRKSETEIITFRAKYKDYRKFNGVWFPVITEETRYRKDGTMNTREVTKVTSALFNVDFPDDFFKIDRVYYGK